MNITQLSEHLKDVPQDTLVGYAKNPTGVVPQFLALAEIQRRQELQTPQNQAPASTVAQDVLNRAAPQVPQMAPPQQAPMASPMAQQLPENQPGVASLPTGMPQGMANGGIVAFAEGGDTEEEEDDDAEMARLFPQKSGVNVEEVLAGIRGLAGKFPQSYDAEKAKFAAVSQRGSHPYEAIALDEARRLGIDPKLVQHILYKETGNLKDPATARSHAGAYGPMQLMPGTAKELGVDIADPEQNTRGGVRYFAKMLEQFKDPTYAMAAYNAGPGRVSNMIRSGRGIESLPRETQGYIRMAQGGIAHFVEGGSNKSDTDKQLQEDSAAWSDTWNKIKAAGEDVASIIPRGIAGAANTGIRGLRAVTGVDIPYIPGDYSSMTPNYDKIREQENAPNIVSQGTAQNRDPYRSAPPKPTKPTSDMAPFNYPPQSGVGVPVPELPSAPPTEAALPKSKSDIYFEALAKDIEERAAQAKEEGDTNKYLAIMQAGFAMMGGQSPYALTNIGKGAEQGVSTYGALEKGRRETQKDIGANRLNLAKYQAAKEGATERLQEERLYRELALGQRDATSAADLAEKARGHTIAERQNAQQNLLKIEQILGAAYDKNVNNIGKPASERDAYIYGNPLFKKSAIDSGLDISQLSPTTGGPEIGTVKGGYKFKGGNPNDKANWEKV